MNDDAGTDGDRNLLARLNALKKSTIDLDQKTYSAPPDLSSEPAIDPHPARSLHANLFDRFKTLSGNSAIETNASVDNATKGIEKHEDEKTIEELLADLGPADDWNVGRSEQDQVEELLRSANHVLAKGPALEKIPDNEIDSPKPGSATLPAIDLAAFQPEPDSDKDTAQPQSKAATYQSIDREADDILQKLLDEVNLENSRGEGDQKGDAEDDDPPPYEEHSSSSKSRPHDTTFDLPSTPSNLPSSTQVDDPNDGDEDLAARFAGLSLPSVPTTVHAKAKTYGKPGQGHTEEEIDSWCIICNDDATLSCVGCDEDLYCTNCWLEGHRGEDAGFEEKSHRAVQYVKGKKKKAPQRRIMLGA